MAYEIPGATRRRITTNGVELTLFEAGPADGPAVLLSHGFPELAYSWRHQIGPLSAAGYHVLAPDQRGYSDSTAPGEIDAYGMEQLCGDLVGILDDAGHEDAVVVGHDWGGIVGWQFPLLHPDRCAGVIGVNTPFMMRPPAPPTQLLRMIAGDDNYIVLFQEPGRAEGVLDANVDRVFSTLMRRGVPPEQMAALATGEGNFLDMIAAGPEVGEAFLTEADQKVYADAFRQSGFFGPVSWYRNLDANWERSADRDGQVPDQPALMICAEWDPVLVPAMAEPMKDLFDDLELHVIAKTGHWTQQEAPDQLNMLILDWLTRRFPA